MKRRLSVIDDEYPSPFIGIDPSQYEQEEGVIRPKLVPANATAAADDTIQEVHVFTKISKATYSPTQDTTVDVLNGATTSIWSFKVRDLTPETDTAITALYFYDVIQDLLQVQLQLDGCATKKRSRSVDKERSLCVFLGSVDFLLSSRKITGHTLHGVQFTREDGWTQKLFISSLMFFKRSVTGDLNLLMIAALPLAVECRNLRL